MEAWNSIFEISGRMGDSSFAAVEKAAIASTVSDTNVPPNTAVDRHVAQLLEQFSTPAFLARESGQIVTQNAAALRQYRVGPDDTLDDLPFALERDEAISDILRATLSPARNVPDAVLKRAYSDSDGGAITLSITPSRQNGRAEALVFVVDARWKTSAAGLIKREFDLTEAERALLEGFLDGQTTQDMARTRGRSHATVRTQFHSLMTKMGARSQTELFRNALSVSQFVDSVNEISEILRHPHRKRVDLVRPGGRSVEVTMAGDLSGRPIVFLQNSHTYTFQSRIEQAFFDAGYCILSICRPGHGDTDPISDGTSYYEGFAADVCALLDQLGFDDCTIMSTNTSSAVGYCLAAAMPNRLIGIIQVAACAPVPHLREDDINVPWVKGMFRAARSTPTIYRFMVKTGLRAYAAMGDARFSKIQFMNDPAEYERARQPEAARESQHALTTLTKQGVGPAIEQVELAFHDYTDIVAQSDMPILMVHGADDQVFGASAIRRFAEALADRATYVEIPGATFSAMTSHTDAVIAEIDSFYTRITPPTNG